MFQYSEIKAVDLNNLPGRKREKGEFTQKLLALEVGQGFEVVGMNRNNVGSRLSMASKLHNRSFGTTLVESGALLVFRKA